MNRKRITELILGDREYDLIPLLRGNETSITGTEMMARAHLIGTTLDQNEGGYILDYQNGIPWELRVNTYFVIPGWRHLINTDLIAIIGWIGICWRGSWVWPERTTCRTDAHLLCRVR